VCVDQGEYLRQQRIACPCGISTEVATGNIK